MSSETKFQYQHLLVLPLIAVLIFAQQCYFQTRELMEERSAVDPNYPKPQDLWICVAALVVFCPLRILLTSYVFAPFGDWLLPSLAQKKTWTAESRADRIERFATVCFKLAYFLMITAIGFNFLQDKNWFPSILGGTGDVRNSWVDFPFVKHYPGLKEYYMISLAYHVQSLIFHIAMHHRNDFLEMTLHHVCAISLVLFSYFNNYVKIGSLVLFIHDIADVVGYSIKASVDTQYTKVTITLYVTLLFTWLVSRLYVFPMYIIATIHYDGHSMIPSEHMHGQGYGYFTAMLYILQCLHVYWFILFILMGFQYTKTGVTADIQQKAGEKWEKAALATNAKND